jgi:hypothetical protein
VTGPRGGRHICDGDIVVTAVAGHYAIGRMTADGKTQKSLGSQQTRAKALQLAHAFAGATHRVFLYGRAGKNDYMQVDGTEPYGT